MNVVRTGIILNVENYDACISFYKNLFNLKVLFKQEDEEFRLTCLTFDNSYLMVETDGFSKPQGKSLKENPTKLRFNVSNIEQALEKIKTFDVDVEIIENEWGATINTYDPDGNRVGIRDEGTFEAQIKN